MLFANRGSVPPEEGQSPDLGVETGLLDEGFRLNAREPPRRWRFAAGTLVSVSLVLVVVAFAGRLNAVPSTVGSTKYATSLGEAKTAACSGNGEDCANSKCCIDGGAKGLQCYLKSKEYGECMDLDSCEPGVHKGEKHGIWDAAGVFQLDKWSCDKAGKVSKPGCDSFDKKKKCPKDRCQWKGDKCRTTCSTFPGPESCWNSGYCMFDGECKDACWEFDEKTCRKHDRCMAVPGPNGTKCSLACHIHSSEDDCPHADTCFWEGGECKKDPCSAPWEDCTQTKCCSYARGGIGMTCFEKNKDYATCMDDFNPEYQKGWSGKKLGNRTKFTAGCSWAGKECSDTHICCNEGFSCAKKDDTFAGCAQTMKVSTWVKQNVPLPEGWEGTNLGGWRGEYEIQPVPEGQDMAGASLYCIMAVLPGSDEEKLRGVAEYNNASIYGCDDHSVYDSWKTDGAGWDTGEVTVVNTAVFLKVMKWVKRDRKYLNHDWLVKVDADCVFLPQRLREHIWGLRPPPDTPMFFKNNDLDGLGNNGFLGAIEVFSKRAIQIYLDNDDDCGEYLGTNSGEDGFFPGCMTALGAGFMWDRQMFEPNFDPSICTNGAHAAYHPIKYPSHWQRCWDLSANNMCPGTTYDCGGDLDPPITSAGIR